LINLPHQSQILIYLCPDIASAKSRTAPKNNTANKALNRKVFYTSYPYNASVINFNNSSEKAKPVAINSGLIRSPLTRLFLAQADMAVTVTLRSS